MSPRLIRVLSTAIPASYVPGSMQAHNGGTANATTMTRTHTFQSTTQDGTVYVVIGIGADNYNTIITVDDSGLDNSTTIEVEGMIGDAHPAVRLWTYKPSQAELTAGSIDLVMNSDGSDVWHTFTCEIIANAATPVEDAATNFSTLGRPSAGSVSVATASSTAVLIALGATEPSSVTTLTFPTLNGFTFPLAAIDQDVAWDPAVNMGYREVLASGTYDSPTLDAGAAGEKCSLLCIAFGSPA